MSSTHCFPPHLLKAPGLPDAHTHTHCIILSSVLQSLGHENNTLTDGAHTSFGLYVATAISIVPVI